MLSLMVLALSQLLADTSFAQNVLADGGFDSQAASVSQYCYNTNCPGGAWSVAGNAGLIKQGNPDWPAPVPISPSFVAFLQGNFGTLSQSVTVPASGNYIVSFYLASRPLTSGSGGDQTVQVTLAGQVVSQTALTSGQTFHRFLSVPVNLTANTAYTLQLAGLASGDNTAFVDSVTVAPAGSVTRYSYDAKGRLVSTNNTGGANDGLATSYTYDKADNRNHSAVTGSSNPTP